MAILAVPDVLFFVLEPAATQAAAASDDGEPGTWNAIAAYRHHRRHPGAGTGDPGGGINTAMLRTGFGERAREFPSPAQWVEKPTPFILGIGPADNGRQLTVA